VLHNLFELYAHEFSEYVPLALKPSGRFEVIPSEAWWTAEGYHPFFIRCGDNLAGFALARRGSGVTGANDVMDVAEFFVVRGMRRRGVGLSAARALFCRFSGNWEVRARKTNLPALTFWLRAAEAVSDGAVVTSAFSADGVHWSLLQFAVPCMPPCRK